MLRATGGGACLGAAGAIIAVACAKSAPVDLSAVSVDAGPPIGFTECQNEYFADYLKPCTGPADCHGVLQCDLTRTFSQTARCHGQQCDVVAQCNDALKALCTGDDFHFECVRSNDLVPTECQIVEGATP